MADSVPAIPDGAARESGELAELRRSLVEALLALERADGLLPRVAAVRTVRGVADALETRAIVEARGERISWAKIGSVYGLTKQGAQQRFGERIARASAAADAPAE